MKILVLGAGMYVTGRLNTGVGTVLASLAQLSKIVDIQQVVVAARKMSNKRVVSQSAKAINTKLKSSLPTTYVSLESTPLQQLCADQAFDCAIVSTPDHLHFEQIQLLMNHRIHVLSVKPLVPTVAENQALIELQKSNQVLGMVEFHKRYDEANLYTKLAVDKGELGQLLYCVIDYSQKVSIPLTTFRDWVEHTNVFQYLGVHYVDLFFFITDMVPIRVSAYGTQGILKQRGIDTYDSIHAQVVWRDVVGREAITVCNISWVDPKCTSAMSDQKYKLIGTLGRIENDHKNRGIEAVTTAHAVQHPNPYFSDYLPDPNGGLEFSGYGYKSIRQFIFDVCSVQQGRSRPEDYDKIRPSFSQALVATAINEAVNKSLTNQSQWVALDMKVYDSEYRG